MVLAFLFFEFTLSEFQAGLWDLTAGAFSSFLLLVVVVVLFVERGRFGFACSVAISTRTLLPD